MIYRLIQDDTDPSIQMYYVMDDTGGNLLKVIDMNCNECEPPSAHSVIDGSPTPPLCAEQQP